MGYIPVTFPIKAEKGHPMPEYNVGGGRRCRYPWKTMEIGESFLIVTEKRQNAAGLVWRAAKKYGRKYTTRCVNKGLRIWRIA